MAETKYVLGFNYFKKYVEVQVIEKLNPILRDKVIFSFEFVFGEIYNHKGLNIKSKELILLFFLLILGNIVPQ